MKLKSITLLIVTALMMGLFVPALKISPVRAVTHPYCWIVDPNGSGDFKKVADAVNDMADVLSHDHIDVLSGLNEILQTDLFITQSELEIIGQEPAGASTSPTIDVNGNEIDIQGTNVFIWGMTIIDTASSPSEPALLIDGPGGSGGSCIIRNNTITGQSAVGSSGIVISNSGNNDIELNTITAWDSCIVVTGSSSSYNSFALNKLTTFNSQNKGIWFEYDATLGRPSSNRVEWNNIYSNNELYDDDGNPQNYFDDGSIKGNYLSVSDPTPSGSYSVPPNGQNYDNYPQGHSVSQIPGDVAPLNGRVDILDAITISNGFIKAWGTYSWVPWADINGDGAVNILDSIILANNWLKHY